MAARGSSAAAREGPAGQRLEGTSPEAAVRRGRERRLLAALADPRLHGQEDAAYFVLRGFGYPASRSLDDVLQVRVSAESDPAVFKALKKLGLNHDGRSFLLRASAEAALPPCAVPTSAPNRQSPCSLQSSSIALRGSRHSAPTQASPAVSRRTVEVGRDPCAPFFDRQALPKVFQRTGPFVAALLAASRSTNDSKGTMSRVRSEGSLLPNATKRGSATSTLSSSALSTEANRSHPVPWMGQWSVCSFGSSGTLHTFSSLQKSPSVAEPLRRWQPSVSGHRHPEDQQSHCQLLSRPRQVASPPRALQTAIGQSAAGVAAERDFRTRLAGLHLNRSRAAKSEGSIDEAIARPMSTEADAADAEDLRAARTAEWLIQTFEHVESLDTTETSVTASEQEREPFDELENVFELADASGEATLCERSETPAMFWSPLHLSDECF